MIANTNLELPDVVGQICYVQGSDFTKETNRVVIRLFIDPVFLNYRGDQLRYGFVSHLIDAFERYGIMFFIDKHEQRGKDLTNLFVRMKESKIALVIFSSRYAESSWCMDELVNIKKRAEKGKLEVIPIFYKVRAKDVRAQAGKFGDKFWALAKVSSGDQIKKWKDALECISNKMGLSLRDKSSEADFIKGIVKEVERVRTATVRGGAQSHHCIKFIPNKRIKISKKFPEDEAKSVEIAHMNFSNATGEEEPSQEVLVLNHDFVK
ncbi:protein PHLOEM PROTEIN 2-LIKE A5 isoform X2 [Brassica rapa]|nr:protein PHLOEM PROTEIN 2-LIKE A5 isoform X2 [Brassica rapa]